MPERGVEYLQKDFTCGESSAQKLVEALRAALK